MDVGHAIDDVELKDFSPITLVALTAMKYIFDVEKFFNAGVEKGTEQERKKNEIESAARDKKIAEYLHSIGVPAESITAALAIK